MEGVAYSLRDCVEVFREMGINVSDMMACGGGGTSPLWRSMLADLYGDVYKRQVLHMAEFVLSLSARRKKDIFPTV